MDANELSRLACDAIQVALQRHTDHSPRANQDEQVSSPKQSGRFVLANTGSHSHSTFSEEDRRKTKSRIEIMFVLREQAADQRVALLEIAGDAAVSFVVDYNFRNNSIWPPLYEKWMYMLVQTLLAPLLKPELVLGGVPRLYHYLNGHQARAAVLAGIVPAKDETNISTEDHENKGTGEPSIETCPIGWGPDKPLQICKSLWPNHEIRQLIWLHKHKTLSQSQAAAKLGRTLHSVTNKWAKIAKEEIWKDYITECETKRTEGELLPRPASPN